MLKTGTAFELNMPKMQIENLVRLSICIPLLEAALGETSFSCVYLRPNVYTSGIFPPPTSFLQALQTRQIALKKSPFCKRKTQRRSVNLKNIKFLRMCTSRAFAKVRIVSEESLQNLCYSKYFLFILESLLLNEKIAVIV